MSGTSPGILLPELKPKDVDLIIISDDHIRGIWREAVVTFAIGWVGLYYVAPSGFWLVVLMALLLAGRIWVLSSRIYWSFPRLSAKADRLCIVREGRAVRSILYEEIGSLQVGVKGEPFWLKILLRSGEVALEVPSSNHIPRRLSAIRSLIRQVGPRLDKGVALLRVTRPDDDIEAMLLESAFNPERVDIRPGVTYRYKSPEKFKKYLESTGLDRVSSIYPCLLLAIATAQILQLGSTFSKLLLFVGYMLAREFVPIRRMVRSVNDTFCFEPDGTLIVKGKRGSRRFRNPELALGWKGALRLVDAPVVRYGSWLTAYYFDPRFIEEKR